MTADIRHTAAVALVAEFAAIEDGTDPGRDRLAAIHALSRLIMDYPHPLADRADWIAQVAAAYGYPYGYVPQRHDRMLADVRQIIATHGYYFTARGAADATEPTPPIVGSGRHLYRLTLSPSVDYTIRADTPDQALDAICEGRTIARATLADGRTIPTNYTGPDINAGDVVAEEIETGEEYAVPTA